MKQLLIFLCILPFKVFFTQSNTLCDLPSLNKQEFFNGIADSSKKINEYKLFVIGELDYFHKGWKLNTDIIKLLVDTVNINKVILEYPVSHQKIFNDYILGENDSLLKYIKNIVIDNNNIPELLTELKNINKVTNEKIEIVCFENETYFNVTVRSLFNLFGDQFDSINPEKTKKYYSYNLLSQLYQKTELPLKKRYKYSRKLVNDFRDNQIDYEIILKENFDVYSKIISNMEGFNKLITHVSNGGFSYDAVLNEKYLVDKYKKYFNTNSNVKALAIMKLPHSTLSPDSYLFRTLPYHAVNFYLNSDIDSPVNNNIFYIFQHYKKNKWYLDDYRSLMGDEFNKVISNKCITVLDAKTKISQKLFKRFGANIIILNNNTYPGGE